MNKDIKSTQNSFTMGIDTVIIRVSDIETSKNWYSEKLGFKPVWEDLNLKLVVMDTGCPTSITLWQTNKKISIDKEIASYPIFRISDADIARNELLGKGASVSEIIEDNVVRYFQIFDLDGNILEACQVHE